MVLKLQKISVLPLAMLFCCLHAAAGFILGALVTAVATATGDQEGIMGLGAWSLLVFPLLNALLGFCAGAFLAGSYNIFSGFFGGIEMEFEEQDRARLSLQKNIS